MIIVKLKGGLGNQLFQYAAARSLALRHAAELKVDITFLGPSRRYGLDRFMTRAAIASPEEITMLTGERRGLQQFVRTVREVFSGEGKAGRNTYLEPHFHYDAGLGSAPDNTYLDGYWQSERYFKEIEGTIRSEFRLRVAADDVNQKTATAIRAVNAVSLHIRRGDYATCSETHEVHGLCPLDYYEEATRIISARVSAPVFFVFSDDPGWVRENLFLDAPMTIVSHNGTELGEEDLRLISLCRHHIIANSSFSWWGAWLNPSTEKIVIAPRRWFNKADIDTADLLPPAWMSI